MSGHSKWSTIKRKKAATDAKRGALFTKAVKNIAVAARHGKDPESNAALRTAIAQARTVNLPKDKIENAILKGAGELPGAVYEEVVYEGYGPGGVAFVIECVSDNTNRTVADVRSMLTKSGGSLGNSGSVMYMFNQKGVVRISKEDLTEHTADDVELLAIDAGAEDIQSEEEGLTITVPREQFHSMIDTFEKQQIPLASSELEWITDTMMQLPPEDAAKIEKLIEALEDNDDVNNVYTNADI